MDTDVNQIWYLLIGLDISCGILTPIIARNVLRESLMQEF